MLVQLIKGTALGMRTWEAGDVSDIETGVGAAFNHGGVGLHRRIEYRNKALVSSNGGRNASRLQ